MWPYFEDWDLTYWLIYDCLAYTSWTNNVFLKLKTYKSRSLDSVYSDHNAGLWSTSPRFDSHRLHCLCTYRVAQKVSHCQESSLNRINNHQRGYIFHQIEYTIITGCELYRSACARARYGWINWDGKNLYYYISLCMKCGRNNGNEEKKWYRTDGGQCCNTVYLYRGLQLRPHLSSAGTTEHEIKLRKTHLYYTTHTLGETFLVFLASKTICRAIGDHDRLCSSAFCISSLLKSDDFRHWTKMHQQAAKSSIRLAGILVSHTISSTVKAMKWCSVIHDYAKLYSLFFLDLQFMAKANECECEWVEFNAPPDTI